MILDGYGLRREDQRECGVMPEAKTPVMDKLMAECPFVRGNASGMAVGLPDGQMGNSEVGHLNMGAGRDRISGSDKDHKIHSGWRFL